jgi:hypothetical protein
VRGLSLGGNAFSPSLGAAIEQAGIETAEARDLAALGARLRREKPDVVICAAAALGADPEAAIAQGLGDAATCPVVLVSEGRLAAGGLPAGTRFSEMLGSGQDALGCFLMLRATLRRKRPHVVTDTLAFGALTLDQEKFVLSAGTASARLNMLEFCVLGAMLDAPRLVWNKVFLNRVVFGPQGQKPGRQFDTYMSRVRRGIRDRIGVDPVVAEHGMGYALSPAVLGPAGILGASGR